MTTNQMEKLMTPDQIVERLERAITQEYDLCAYEDEVLALCAAYRELAGWKPVTEHTRGLGEIVYWTTTSSTKGEGFISSCKWHEADEGVQEGWWDDSCTEIVDPDWWLCPLPLPPQEGK